jgi:hypothetical protein
MTQQQREATALRVNLAEAKANVLRTDAARLDLEKQVGTELLELERLYVELDNNAQARARQAATVADLEARVATYEPVTLKVS